MENIVRKGEIACNKQFLLFLQCFLHYRALILRFKCTLKFRLQVVSIWTSLKSCCLVMGTLTSHCILLDTLWRKAFENMKRKGENAGYQLFFPCSHYVILPVKDRSHHLSFINFVVYTCFQLVEYKILSFGKGLTHSHTMTPFDASGKEAFGKHCGKWRNCLYKQFLLFPQCFLSQSKTDIIIFVTFNLSSANAFNLVWSRILLCGKGLRELFYCVVSSSVYSPSNACWIRGESYNIFKQGKCLYRSVIMPKSLY